MKIRLRLVNAMDRNGDVLTGEAFVRAVHDWAQHMDAIVHETGTDYAICSLELPDDDDVGGTHDDVGGTYETDENTSAALRAP